MGRGERERICCLTSTEDKASERANRGEEERERVCCLTSTEDKVSERANRGERIERESMLLNVHGG